MKPTRFVGSDADVDDIPLLRSRFAQRTHFEVAVAPCAITHRPAIHAAPICWGLLSPDPIKMMLIVLSSTKVFRLNAPPFFDDFVGFGLKLHHRRQVGRDGIGGPNFGVDNTIERPAQLLYSAQAGYRVFVS